MIDFSPAEGQAAEFNRRLAAMERRNAQTIEAVADAVKDVLERLNAIEAKGASPWLNPPAAAAYAHCAERTLEGYRRTGGGPAYHRQGGRVVLYHKDDLDAWRGKGRASNTTDERLRGVKLAG